MTAPRTLIPGIRLLAATAAAFAARVGFSRLSAGTTSAPRIIMIRCRVLAGHAAPLALRQAEGVRAVTLPLACARMFAVLSVLMRRAKRDEPTFPAVFRPGAIGAVPMTGPGLPHRTPMLPRDMAFLAACCWLSILSDRLLPKRFERVGASRVPVDSRAPLVCVTGIGLAVQDAVPEFPVVIGGMIVVLAGLCAPPSERRTA